MLRVYNDHVLVELKKTEWATSDEADHSGKEDPKAGEGVVVAIPELDDILFFSNYSWVLEQSPFNPVVKQNMHEAMQKLLGKKVYFEKRADLGNTIEHEGKTFATIKLAKIIAVEEDN